MKPIRKGRPPKELVEYAAEPVGTGYEQMPEPVKQAVRAALTQEQGSLCAYCMQRIFPQRGSMKIDHRSPRNPGEGGAAGRQEAELAYRNMLGACKGGEGQPRLEQHCDTHKGNAALRIDPTDVSSGWDRAIHYRLGRTLAHARAYEVHSDNAEHEEDIHRTLNLNIASLAVARWAAVEEAIDGIGRKHEGPWTRAVLTREIRRYEGRDVRGRHAPFVGAILYYLRKHLARCPR